MSGKGYIKIDRKIDSWEYRHDMSRLGFWLHLLLSAEWKGPERGSFITSIRELEQGTSLTHRTITKFLDELEELQQILKNELSLAQEYIQWQQDIHDYEDRLTSS